ncbi:MAG: M23 family metallopeptidase [Proteobacteria bacterium]|nr:M23 family metallopeptidase [Pseudomonadota bacterium]MBU1386978.1 M23 family metallopeptidase [Pseudomonadota bacterium]MBU1542341.1 M23 family metallopeptidase [Pseudomonadota bacterium]MBU2481804.1 M23 family metallopeptidase [Pseudomonadota bacterium]
MKRVLFWILIMAVIVPSVWVFLFKFEGEKPSIDIVLPSVYLQKDYEFSVLAADNKNGLRKIVVSVMQQGKEKILLEKQNQSASFLGLFPQSAEINQSFVVPVDTQGYGMADGEAVIRVMVSDFSWRGWNRGNIAYVEKPVVIDTKPPAVSVLSQHHNMERGGSALVIYKVFEDKITSGVLVGENFFPGHPGLFDDDHIHAAFFALDHTQGPGTPVRVVVRDLAGNTTKRDFYHFIRDKQFKKDTLNISQGFLENKIPGFDVGAMEQTFATAKNPLLEKFLYINKTIRKNNVDLILSTPAVTENKKYWDGRFLRLTGSSRRAGFADQRTYNNGGRTIDHAVHLGIDLASTANAPVKAANGGRVIFTQFVGIFGNTVMIDHGFGLTSLYSHLNQITVEKGTLVQQGDLIGYTGITGLAGGDHLHFSMIVHNVFVNPVEWWDDTWIENNITSKIDAVKQLQKQ